MYIHSENRIVILTSGLLFEFQHITCMDIYRLDKNATNTDD